MKKHPFGEENVSQDRLRKKLEAFHAWDTQRLYRQSLGTAVMVSLASIAAIAGSMYSLASRAVSVQESLFGVAGGVLILTMSALVFSWAVKGIESERKKGQEETGERIMDQDSSPKCE